MKIVKLNKIILNFLFVTVFISFMSELSAKENQKPAESFPEFREKFYSDTLFQKSRILFPMPGISTDDMEYSDTIYYWQESEWLFLEDMSLGEQMKVEIIKTETTVQENNHWENSNFDANVSYKLIDRKWYLVRLEIYNM